MNTEYIYVWKRGEGIPFAHYMCFSRFAKKGKVSTNFELRCYAPEKGLKTCKACGITPQLGGGYRMFYSTA